MDLHGHGQEATLSPGLDNYTKLQSQNWHRKSAPSFTIESNPANTSYYSTHLLCHVARSPHDPTL